MWSDDVGDRPADRLEGRDSLLSGGFIPGVTECEHENLRAVHLLWQERQGRGLPHHDPAAELVRRRRDESPVLAEHPLRRRERVDDEPGGDLGTDGVEPELERCHHAEVPAAAADRQQQPVLRRQAYGLDHVTRAPRSHDRRGALVDHRVPDRPRLLVPGLAGKAEIAAQPSSQGADRLGRETRALPVGRSDCGSIHREPPWARFAGRAHT